MWRPSTGARPLEKYPREGPADSSGVAGTSVGYPWGVERGGLGDPARPSGFHLGALAGEEDDGGLAGGRAAPIQHQHDPIS
eukprot:9502612-Pyramimonas_sp.AAC.1